MRTVSPRAALLTLLLALVAGSTASAQGSLPFTGAGQGGNGVPAPADVIGFTPGEDYKLADHTQLLAYYRALADASDRVQMVEIGRTTRGRPMVLLYISTPQNLARLERWREISQRLGRAEGLTDDAARELAREGKAVVWIDAGLHSTEVAHSQFAPHLAYHMATDESEESRRIREDVLLLLMPVMNPDGHEIVVSWYRENLGTPFETTGPPDVYHEYVGHDINRDWFMFRTAEAQVVGRQLFRDWLPQIVFNHHQTAPFPARIFIPPFADPVNPHIDPRVVRGVNLVGDHMAHRLEMERMPGVVSRMTFTMWWNGGLRTAPYFHNQIGILSEVGHASATPANHDPATFSPTFGQGSAMIPTLEPTIFYTNPWRGGRASIGDAVRYHFVSSIGALDMAQKNREHLLYTFYEMGRDAIAAGRAGGPYAYVVSLPAQHDAGEAVEMLNTLREGAIQVERATAPFTAGGRQYPAGSYVLRADQSFRAHLLDMMEPQEHPHRELYPGGPPEPPYGGLAGYTLPFQMGVAFDRIEQPFELRSERVERVGPPPSRITGRGPVLLLSATETRAFTALHRLLGQGATVSRAAESFRVDRMEFAAGTLVVEGAAAAGEAAARQLGLTVHRVARRPAVSLRPVQAPRIAIYRPWTANMDEGWTRLLLDHYGIPHRRITDQQIRAGDFGDADVILFTSQGAQGILRGHAEGRMPERFVGGVSTAGVGQLQRFVREGGRLVALDAATDFLLEHFQMPVRNVLAGVETTQFYIPGSLLRIAVDADHPVGFGMQRETAAFFQNSRAFAVEGAGAEVVASYPGSELLRSGWEVGAQQHLANRAAVVRAPYGQGDLVLIGFRPQFRAQPAATFKLLFNALHGAAEGARAGAGASGGEAAAVGR